MSYKIDLGFKIFISPEFFIKTLVHYSKKKKMAISKSLLFFDCLKNHNDVF